MWTMWVLRELWLVAIRSDAKYCNEHSKFRHHRRKRLHTWTKGEAMHTAA
jgi:hypothetical protein